MPKYTYKLTNGKTLTLEGDAQPSDTDIEEAASGAGVKLLEAGQEPTWWQTHPKTAAVTRGALHTLPALGALAGGAIASPTLATGLPGLAAEAGAVGLGAGAGKGAEDLIAEGIGLNPKTTPASKALRIGGETAMGAGTAAVVPGVIEAAKTPLKTVGSILRMPSALRKLAWSGEVAPELALPASTPKPILERFETGNRVDMSPEAGTQPKLLPAGSRPSPTTTAPLQVQGPTAAELATEPAAVRPSQSPVQGAAPASRFRNSPPSATPGFSVEDVQAAGGNPALNYTKADPAFLKKMTDARASRQGIHIANAELSNLEKQMLQQ